MVKLDNYSHSVKIDDIVVLIHAQVWVKNWWVRNEDEKWFDTGKIDIRCK